MSSTPTVVQQLWESFRHDPSGDHFLPDSHVVFIPTGAGAAGDSHVQHFYRTGGFSHPKQLAVEETVIHRTVGEASAVDQVEVTIKFVSGNGGWLLPGIAAHHLEDVIVTFPLVICASFAEDKIASVRYFWDSASVLKQVRLIGSRQSWPIVAEAQVDALRNPSNFRLNPFGNPSSIGAGARPAQTGISNIFGATPPISPSPSTGSASPPKKGHPALTSTVFSNLKSEDSNKKPQGLYERERVQSAGNDVDSAALKLQAMTQTPAPTPAPAPQVKKGHPALTSTIFSQQPQQQQQQQPAIQKKGHPALTSTIFSQPKNESTTVVSPRQAPPAQQQQQDIDPSQQAAGWRADYVKPKGHPALTSSIFSNQPPQPTSTPTYTRPYKNTGQNIFGPPRTEEGPKSTTTIAAQPATVKSPSEEKAFELQPSTIEDDEGQLGVVQETKELQNGHENNSQEEEEEEGVAKENLHNGIIDPLPLEKMAIQDVVVVEKATPLLEAKEAPLSPTPPAPAPVQQPARRVHPNYRSQISFG
ncbi:hypothetical protein BG004_005105 [Podila humilis]|nr:hypothetical protein BG004_005105 [Podila humilis]